MNKIEDILTASKLSDLLSKKEEPKKTNVLLWIFAVIGAIAAVAAIAYAVYKYLTPGCLEDMDDDLDDDFDDDFFEDEEPAAPEKEEAAKEEAVKEEPEKTE